MAFIKVKHGREEIFTLLVNDIDGREIERWVVHKRDFIKVIKIISKKFGLKIKVIDKNDKDDDLDWAIR